MEQARGPREKQTSQPSERHWPQEEVGLGMGEPFTAAGEHEGAGDNSETQLGVDARPDATCGSGSGAETWPRNP